MIREIGLSTQLYRLPVRASAAPATDEPVDQFKPSAATPPKLPWAEMQKAGLLEATANVPGPVGAMLSQSAKDGLLDFFQRMEGVGAKMHTLTPGPPDRAHLIGDLNAEQATQKVLTQGFQEPLFMKDPKTGGLYQLANCQDLQLLDTMFGAGEAAGGPRPELAKMLRDLTQEHGFRVDSDRGDCDFSKPDSTLVYSGSRPLAAYRSALGLETADTKLIPPDLWTGFGLDELDKIEVLDFFLGTGTDHGLKNRELADDLKAIDKAGFLFDKFPFKSLGLTEKQGATWTYLGLEEAPDTESVWMHRPDKAYFPVHPEDLGNLEHINARADKMDSLHETFEPRLDKLELAVRLPVFTWLSFQHYPQLNPEAVFDAGIKALETTAERGQQPPVLELRDALADLSPHLKTEEDLRLACHYLVHSFKDESLADRANLLAECKESGADYLTEAQKRFEFFTPGVGGSVTQEGQHLNVGGVRLRVRQPHP